MGSSSNDTNRIDNISISHPQTIIGIGLICGVLGAMTVIIILIIKIWRRRSYQKTSGNIITGTYVHNNSNEGDVYNHLSRDNRRLGSVSYNMGNIPCISSSKSHNTCNREDNYRRLARDNLSETSQDVSKITDQKKGDFYKQQSCKNGEIESYKAYTNTNMETCKGQVNCKEEVIYNHLSRESRSMKITTEDIYNHADPGLQIAEVTVHYNSNSESVRL